MIQWQGTLESLISSPHVTKIEIPHAQTQRDGPARNKILLRLLFWQRLQGCEYKVNSLPKFAPAQSNIGTDSGDMAGDLASRKRPGHALRVRQARFGQR